MDTRACGGFRLANAARRLPHAFDERGGLGMDLAAGAAAFHVGLESPGLRRVEPPHVQRLGCFLGIGWASMNQDADLNNNYCCFCLRLQVSRSTGSTYKRGSKRGRAQAAPRGHRLHESVRGAGEGPAVSGPACVLARVARAARDHSHRSCGFWSMTGPYASATTGGSRKPPIRACLVPCTALVGTPAGFSQLISAEMPEISARRPGRSRIAHRGWFSISRSQSGRFNTSRGLLPSGGPMMPSRCIMSRMRAARP